MGVWVCWAGVFFHFSYVVFVFPFPPSPPPLFPKKKLRVKKTRWEREQEEKVCKTKKMEKRCRGKEFRNFGGGGEKGGKKNEDWARNLDHFHPFHLSPPRSRILPPPPPFQSRAIIPLPLPRGPIPTRFPKLFSPKPTLLFPNPQPAHRIPRILPIPLPGGGKKYSIQVDDSGYFCAGFGAFAPWGCQGGGEGG